MSLEPQQLAELHDLLWELRSGTAASEQLSRLERMVCEDAEVREFYIRYMHLCADLHWNCVEEVMGKAEGGRRKVEEENLDGSVVELPNQLENLPLPFGELAGTSLPSPLRRGAVENLPSPFGRGAGGEGSKVDAGSQEPVPSTPYSVLRTPYFTLPSLLPTTPLGNVAFSYAMSALLVCIGLFIFSLMSASSPSNAVVHNESAVPQYHTPPNAPAPKPKIVSIASITGMVDCVWVNADDAPFHNRVVLGTKYMLKSGLMEITYHTGAKVILQGPCAYEVESADGGFLSLGKLTARVESRSRLPGGTQPTDLDAAESRPAGGTYFAVRTPTAVVTDLGTEFGVEVHKSGRTQAHVLVGKVRVTSSASNGTDGGRVLTSGQTAQVAEQGVVENFVPDAKATLFVRTMPKPKPESINIVVLAHYRLGEDDNGAAAGEPAMKTTKDAKYSWALERHGSPRYTADTGTPGSSLAMLFHGSGDEGDHYVGATVVSADFDNFGVEAWVKPRNDTDTGAIVWNGDHGWGLLQRKNVLCGHMNTGGDVGRYRFVPDQWHHIALVRDRGQATLYVNGKSEECGFRDGYGDPVAPNGRFWIGCTDGKYHFSGAIDEVRVFTFVPGMFHKDDLLYKK